VLKLAPTEGRAEQPSARCHDHKTLFEGLGQHAGTTVPHVFYGGHKLLASLQSNKLDTFQTDLPGLYRTSTNTSSLALEYLRPA
jgi:hypothetical protein